jgi:hypothetical protein
VPHCDVVIPSTCRPSAGVRLVGVEYWRPLSLAKGFVVAPQDSASPRNHLMVQLRGPILSDLMLRLLELLAQAFRSAAGGVLQRLQLCSRMLIAFPFRALK